MNKAPRKRRPGASRLEKERSPKVQHSAPPPTDRAAGAPLANAGDERVTVVAIGASAGGLAALKAFFAHVPKGSGVAYVVIMHLSPEHESHLEELLQPHVAIPVVQVTTTVSLERNHVYVIPPRANLEAVDTHLRLAQIESRRQARAPIDHFFRTLAETHDGRAVGIVLTGTGSDGALGLRWIKERGGLAVVQDPADAEYDGMPKSALAVAPVDLVLPLAKIPGAVLRFAKTEPRLVVPEEGAAIETEERRFLHELFAIILARSGRDFSHYKRSTLLRRIARRMQFNHVREPSAYLDMLRRQPSEVGALIDDLLIKVTSFFRDAEVFAALEQEFIPKLFEGKGPSDSVRAWSVGSATGEEAYSIAILLLEEAARRGSSTAIQVFATDLHQQSLDRAREGLFPANIEADVSPERLHRFFQREDGGYRVRREVRDLLVFAQHDVLAEPPFSRLDLVSCRNLFIYLDRELHQQLAKLFQYALRPGGFLVLGTSETVNASEFFLAEDRKRSIYRRLNVAAAEPRLPVFSAPRQRVAHRAPIPGARHEPLVSGAVHQRLVEQYAPPSVLLSPDDHVVHFSAHAGRYLVHPGGSPTTNVFRIVRDELRVELRAAVSVARAQRKAVRTKPLAVRFNGGSCPVVLDVRPALDPEQEGFLLLILDEQPGLEPEKAAVQPTPAAEGLAKARALEAGREVAEERLQQVIKDYETGQEDLRATNEELQSANEELRSTLEELESSKEELQSMNEELQTVNQESHHKVEELGQLSSDLQNLFAATDIATIFLDRELRILRFTPKTADLFNVRANDRGRPLSDFTHRLGYEDLTSDAAQVLERLVPIEREVHDKAGRWYLMRVLPYRDTKDRIGGVVVTFVEITARRRAEDALRREKDYSEHIIQTLPDPLLVLGSDLRVRIANAAFYDHFKVGPAETEGRRIYDLGNGQWNIPALRELLERVLPENEVFVGYKVSYELERLGRRVMLVNGRRVESMQLILVGLIDVTDLYETERALRSSEDRLHRMINVEGVGVLNFDMNGTLVDANDTFLAMSGYSREEVERGALSWRSMTPPEFVEVSERQMERLKRTGGLGPYEKQYLRKDGSRPWLLFAGAALGDGTTVEYCIDVSDRKRVEEEREQLLVELGEAQKLSRADLDAMTRLQRLGTLFVRERNLEPILGEIMDAAMAISGADLGSIQLLDPSSSDLRIVAHRGFPKPWVEFWSRVSLGQGVCGTALEAGERIIVEDVERSPIFAGTQALEVQLQAGVRAVQSTPLVSRSGQPLGIFSTHYRRPSRPDDRSLRLLDLLARQAADIIERTQSEEVLSRERELLQQLFKSVPVLLVMWDPAIRRFSLNRHAEEVLGWSTDEANAVDLMSMVYPDSAYRAEVVAFMQSLKPGFREFSCRTKSGEDVPLAWANIRLRDESMIGIGVDLRERKHSEDALRVANDRLAEADRRKNEFLAVLSHELRNPLAPISNSLYILHRAAPGSEQARRAQAVIERQVEQLRRLIEDLLDVTRITRGKALLQREPVELCELARRTVDDHRSLFNEAGVELVVSAGPTEFWVDGDRARLAQVLGNLLQNAAKFTLRGGKVAVSVEADANQGQAAVRVQDTGRGIPQEMLPHLFEPFTQADVTLDRKMGGLGLGLALVKGLVEMHGGAVEAASDGPGKGATFTIRLPTGPAPTEAAARHATAGPSPPRRVLVIEHNVDAAESLREVLELEGHHVGIAYNGLDGIEKARAFEPDLVICDVGLPGMDGYGVAQTMRADPELSRVPLVALTGHAGADDVARARAAGFDDHLAKPPSMEALEHVLRPLSP